MQNLILIALIGVIYAFLFVPQQRRAKAHRELIASLGEGDEVVLDSGIHGFVGAVEENVIWVEVDEGTELKVNKSSVSAVVNHPTEIDSEG